MRVVKFSKQNCNPCTQVKKYLDDKGVKYENIDIELTEDFDFVLKNNIRNVPTVLVLNDREEVIRRVVGFKEEELKEAVC